MLRHTMLHPFCARCTTSLFCGMRLKGPCLVGELQSWREAKHRGDTNTAHLSCQFVWLGPDVPTPQRTLLGACEVVWLVSFMSRNHPFAHTDACLFQAHLSHITCSAGHVHKDFHPGSREVKHPLQDYCRVTDKVY